MPLPHAFWVSSYQSSGSSMPPRRTKPQKPSRSALPRIRTPNRSIFSSESMRSLCAMKFLIVASETSSSSHFASRFVFGLVLGVVCIVAVLLSTLLTVAVGRLAYRVLVFQSRPQGASDGGQRGRQPGQDQVVAGANRVLEGRLEVVARHKDPCRQEDEGEQHGVGEQHRYGYGQHCHAVVERRPLWGLPIVWLFPQFVGDYNPGHHRHDRRHHQRQEARPPDRVG